jgi:hypothetical protein
MGNAVVSILSIERVTHDVRRYRVERPAGYSFQPGQATELSIDDPRWIEEKRPFTFTGLVGEPFLEFTIKSYRERDGVTRALGNLNPGATLIVREAWGSILFEKPGLFVAAGAGVTPFIAIFKQLRNSGRVAGNKLLLANKKAEDVIDEDFWRSLLGDNFHSKLSREKATGHDFGHIGRADVAALLDRQKDQVYLCGPDAFVDSLRGLLAELGLSEQRITREL